MKDQPSYLCRTCGAVMCDDCKSIAEEHERLLALRTNALMRAEEELQELRAALQKESRDRARWEELSKLGMPELLKQFIDSRFHGEQVA